MKSAVAFPLLFSLLYLLPSSAARQILEPRKGNTSDLALLPQCSLKCSMLALPTSKCAPTDTECLCADQQLSTTILDCSQAACTSRDLQYTLNAYGHLCSLPLNDRTCEYVATSWTALALSSVSVLVRLVSRPVALAVTQQGRAGLPLRTRLLDAYGLDDLFVVLAFAVSGSFFILPLIYMPRAGFGRDFWSLAPDQVTDVGRSTYILTVIYGVALMLLKVSFLCLYRRVFRFKGLERACLHATFGLIMVPWAVGFFLAIFQCTPISAFWDSMDHPDHKNGAKCISLNGLAWYNSVSNVVTDFAMLALPLSQIRKLSGGLGKKLAVGSMFAVGIFLTAVSIIRMHALAKFANSTNPTVDNVDILTWSDAELSVGFLCSCMPAARVLFRELVLEPRRRRCGDASYGATHASQDGGGGSRRRASPTSALPLGDWPPDPKPVPGSRDGRDSASSSHALAAATTAAGGDPGEAVDIGAEKHQLGWVRNKASSATVGGSTCDAESGKDPAIPEGW